MRGLIGGFGAGLLTAVLGFAAVSLIVPLPERVAPEAGAAPGTKAPVKAVGASPAIADLPEAAQFDSAGAERAPQLAPPAGAPVAGGAAPVAPVTESEAPEPAMSGMTPPARPEAGAGAGSEMAQPAPETAQAALAAPVEAEAPVPVPPPGEVETPALVPAEGEGAAPAEAGEMPQESAAVALPDPGASGAQAETAPETTPQTDLPATEAPATAEAATDPVTAAPALAPPASPEPAKPAEGGAAGTDIATDLPSLPPVLVPETGVETAPEIVLLPDGSPVPDATLPRVFRPDGTSTFKPSAAPGAGLPEVAGVRVNRLPTIGTDPAAPAEDALPQADALLPEGGADRPALRRFAASFAGAEGLPRYAVVIVDEGEAAGGLDRTTLKTLGFPVTVAIDPERPDAAQAAAEYRAAGLEVAILARALPLGATAADLEVALEDWHRKLPEAIAVVEPARPLIQNNRPLAQQLVKILAREGLGLVTQRQGLNAAAQIAGSEGLPEAELWRVLDTARDDAPVIERTLSRAAFEAQREGQVAVMISSWPQSVAGLMSWAAAGEGKVALAPVSALMPEGKF